MNIENLEHIERKYNFNYPGIYKNLLQDDMLNWGQFCSDWSEIQYPKLKDIPPLLLYGVDFEIMEYEQILEEIESFTAEDDYIQTKKEFYNKFIPFGRTAGGDLYCLFLNESNKIGSIVLVLHDDNEVEILADTLEKFIFRNLLECVIDPYSESLIMKGDFKDNIIKQLLSHKKYLNTKQIEIIEEIYQREQPLLEYKEFNQILEKMDFKISDNTFEYQED